MFAPSPEVGWLPSPRTCHESVRSLNASTPSRNPLYLIERDCRPIPFTQEEKRYFSKTAISQPTCCLDRGRHPCAQRVVDCVGRNTQTKAPQTPFRVMGRSRNSLPRKLLNFNLGSVPNLVNSSCVPCAATAGPA